MEERVTINDVARESGCSPATVSLVLNNRPGVSQQTRARVQQVAERLGYALKANQSLGRSGKLATLGVLVKTESSTPPTANPFYSRVIIGIEEACRRSGINMLFGMMPVDENNRPSEVHSLMNSGAADGLLLVGAFVDATISSATSKSTPPIVLVDGYSDSESYDAVVSDNFRAAYQAVEHLIRKGHRHIALIGSEPGAYPSLRDRRYGYLRALKENKITNTYIANFNINRSHGYEETTQLLTEHPEITALFGVNDEMAWNAMLAAQDMGLCVPQDLSVIGFDDSLVAARSGPPLTTMRVDTFTLGRAAVQLLALRVENPGAVRMTLIVHPELIERESVAGPRAAGR